MKFFIHDEAGKLIGMFLEATSVIRFAAGDGLRTDYTVRNMGGDVLWHQTPAFPDGPGDGKMEIMNVSHVLNTMINRM